MRATSAVVLAACVVLAIGDAAEAAFTTVGVYDPASVNDVDQSGAFESATGGAGAGNVVDLAGFQALIGSAYSADRGGVVEFESTGALEAGGGSFIANYGTSGAKSLTISSGNSAFRYPGLTSGSRLPVSGTGAEMLSKESPDIDFSFDIGAIAGGIPHEGVTHFGVTAIERDGANHGDVRATAMFSDGSTVTAKATMTGQSPSNNEDTFFGFVAPAGGRIIDVYVDYSANFTNVDDVAFITAITDAPVTEVSYRQPLFSDSTNSPHSVFGWSALVETNTASGVVDYVFGANGSATAVAGGTGSPNTPDPVNATTEVPSPTTRGYGYYAPRSDDNVPTGAGSLHFTGDVPDVDVSRLVSVWFESRNDNDDAAMRVALKIGSQWYASALDFGDDGSENVWTSHIFDPLSVEAAANWYLLNVTEGAGGEISVGSPAAADLAGIVTDFGLYVDAGRSPIAGDHARFDNYTVIVGADIIPEPTTIALLALGGLLARVRRRRT